MKINQKTIQDFKDFTGRWHGTVPARGSLKDYKILYIAHLTGDYTEAHQTRLYNLHGGTYCAALEVLHHYFMRDRDNYQEMAAFAASGNGILEV